TWATVLVCSMAGLSAMAAIGMLPGPILSLLLSVLLVALLLDREALILVILLHVTGIIAIGWLAGAGIITPMYTLGNDLREWVASVFVFGALTAISAMLVWHVIRKLEAALARSEQERQRAEVAIQERLKTELLLQQSQKLEALGRLAGGIAHDFNNALQVIFGWTNLLQQEATDPETLNIAGELERTARSAAGLPRQLLTFSRQRDTTLRPLDVVALTREWSQALGRLQPDGCTLDLQLSAVPQVQADASLLQQALLNLITNAHDASPTLCTIVIGTDTWSLSQVREHVSECAPTEQWVHLWVRDSGVGIDEQTLSHIFEPFFTTKGDQGNGLGLSMVYGSIRQLGGHTTAESQPGEGSTFHIFLPAQEQESEPEPEPESIRLRGQVLLAEDEDGVRRIMARSLQRAGLEVIAACDGTEAMTALEQSEGLVDLLCIDAVMPGTPTSEVIDRYHEQRPSGVVLLCSGHVRDARLEARIASGEVTLLAKPFPSSQLIATIRELLR
ncbi:MAG: two-component system cell cycle sensor histidine kinase/response regulator CckA, partial [Myxococcota bacterium]